MPYSEDQTKIQSIRQFAEETRRLAGELEVTTSSDLVLANAQDWRRTLDDLLTDIQEAQS